MEESATSAPKFNRGREVCRVVGLISTNFAQITCSSFDGTAGLLSRTTLRRVSYPALSPGQLPHDALRGGDKPHVGVSVRYELARPGSRLTLSDPGRPCKRKNKHTPFFRTNPASIFVFACAGCSPVNSKGRGLHQCLLRRKCVRR